MTPTREQQIERHGAAMTSRSVGRHAKQSAGPALALARHIWRLLPGYADELAFELGLLDTDLSFEETRRRNRINERARRYADSADFSVRIRN